MALVYFDNRQDKKEMNPNFMESLKVVIDTALEKEGIHIPVEVSISFVDNQEIQELNHTYRNKNQPTDVLSFPLQERDYLYKMEEVQEEVLLGDIIISIPKAMEQAEEYGHSFLREMSYLIVHGIYHLLGYDHLNPEDKKVMREKEESVMDVLKITR